MASITKGPTTSKTRAQVQSCDSNLSQDSSINQDKDKSPVPQEKRLPPIKAPVGLARSPDLRNCKSKVGSLEKIKHKPSGGRVKIETQKLQWNAKSKVGSLDNKDHKPAPPRFKVETKKLEWKTSPKVQSFQNIKHQPGGGNVKIFDDSHSQDKSALPAANNKQDNHINSAANTITTTHPSPSAASSNNNNNNQTSAKTATANNSADSIAKGLKSFNLKAN